MNNNHISKHQRHMTIRETFKFKSTNAIWNHLGLNRAWVIGYLTKLFKNGNCSTVEEWETYYYNSGKERYYLLGKVSPEKRTILKNIGIFHFKKENLLNQIEIDEKELNSYYGRTEQQLESIGKFMFGHLNYIGNKNKITLEECIEFVKIRVIDETFIGMTREKNTVKNLEKIYPALDFKEVSVEKDAKYAVDYEVFDGDKLLLALQIKSSKYKNNNSNILAETKGFNGEKNDNYKKQFGKEVIYVYSKENGDIENKDVFETIKNYVEDEIFY